MAQGASGTSTQASSSAAFAAVLLAEHDALGAFISLLQAEQEILVHGDADRLAAIAPEKSAQIDLLTRVGQKRDRFLSDQKLPLSAHGVESWLKREPALAAATRKIWSESLRRAEMARQLNINNGMLIENRMQQNRQKLSVLQAAARPDNVYGSSGHMGPFRGGRAIGQV
ncbi:MAG: flagellar protein FlgN [Proteobacteria bacterium]|nr:flagellar protein FlgN [Pseudomonadota bacterium]